MNRPLSVQGYPLRHWMTPLALVVSIYVIFFMSLGISRNFLAVDAWLYRPYFYFFAIYIFSRGWTPDTPISSKHLKFIAIGLIGTALGVTFFALLGFGATYKNVTSAIYIALIMISFICLVLFFTSSCSPDGQRKIPIWAYFACAAVAALIWPHWGGDWPEGSAMRLMGDMVMNFLFTGMAEELMFRGVTQGYLLKQWGEKDKLLGISYANWATSLLFAYGHNPLLKEEFLPWFIYLLPMGIFFGLLRERTGTWLVPGIAHGMVTPFAVVITAITGLEWKD